MAPPPYMPPVLPTSLPAMMAVGSVGAMPAGMGGAYHGAPHPMGPGTVAPRSFLTDNTLNGAYQQRWGSSLTPLALTAALRGADLGVMYQLADLLDEVRETDPHVQAVLSRREQSVAGAGWELRPSRAYAEGGDETAMATAARQLCDSVLRSLPGLPDRLADLMGAVYYGRAVAEVVWSRQGGYLVPTRMYPVHPRMIQYDYAWNLRLWSNMPPYNFGPYPGVDVKEFPAGRFIVHTPRIRGGFATREGLGRTLAWWALFKRWVTRDAMGLAEMAGRLARIAKYQSGKKDGAFDPSQRSSDEDVQYITTTLNNWSASVGLVYPDDIEVQLVPPVTGNTIHQPLIDFFNAEMSKAVLGSTLTVEAGFKGARSLGEVHADEETKLTRYDAGSLAETLRVGLLAPIVHYNYGPHVPVPEIRFLVDAEESRDSLAKRIEILVRAGLKVGQRWVRDEFGIPDPQEGDALMGGTYERVMPSVADPGIDMDTPDNSRVAIPQHPAAGGAAVQPPPAAPTLVPGAPPTPPPAESVAALPPVEGPDVVRPPEDSRVEQPGPAPAPAPAPVRPAAPAPAVAPRGQPPFPPGPGVATDTENPTPTRLPRNMVPPAGVSNVNAPILIDSNDDGTRDSLVSPAEAATDAVHDSARLPPDVVRVVTEVADTRADAQAVQDATRSAPRAAPPAPPPVPPPSPPAAAPRPQQAPRARRSPYDPRGG